MTGIASSLLALALAAHAAAAPRKTPVPKPAPARTATPAPTAAPAATPAPTAVPASGPRTISLIVTDIGGGFAYVTPGEKAGLAVGQTVQIAGRAYKIAEVTAQTASVTMLEPPLTVGATGQAVVSEAGTTAVVSASARQKALAAATPAPSWSAATKPVAAATPPPRVPLSAASARSQGMWNAIIGVRASALNPTKPSNTRGVVGPAYTQELAARASTRFGAASPFAADADLSALGWNGAGLPSGAQQRPSYFVRELDVRYGDHDDPLVSAGRLRRAAWMLGALDGAHARVPFGPFSIGAFGGVVPDPQSGKASADAKRFGMEFAWRASTLSWRPELIVVANGSTFNGHTDERRVMATGSVFGPRGGAFAYVESSAFDKVNPWNAYAFELTAAGADASVRVGPLRLGARADSRVPERSLWLQSHLPPSSLCVAAPSVGSPEPCDTLHQRRWLGSADAELGLRWIAWSAGATSASWGTGPNVNQDAEAFTDLRTVGLPHGLRVAVGAHDGQGTLVDGTGGYVTVGRMFVDDRLDASLTYRSASYTYRALPDKRNASRVEAGLQFAARGNVDVGLLADLDAGGDAKGTFLLFTTTWHAR